MTLLEITQKQQNYGNQIFSDLYEQALEYGIACWITEIQGFMVQIIGHKAFYFTTLVNSQWVIIGADELQETI